MSASPHKRPSLRHSSRNPQSSRVSHTQPTQGLQLQAFYPNTPEELEFQRQLDKVFSALLSFVKQYQPADQPARLCLRV